MSLIAHDRQIEFEEDDWLDEHEPDGYEEYQWGCDFSGECLMPGDHMRMECYTREMAEEWARDFRRSVNKG
jgi:hypothetical protein